jgi:hypothetical protein
VTNLISQLPVALPLPHDCSATCACGVEPLAHPKYSFGMLLEARHLALEHRYSSQRLNTHDIRLHDFGTVCGLRVVKHPSPECVDKYAILQPGIALDCCGREIVVPETLFVPLFDGAQSGWCGAPQSSVQTPPSGTKRTTLYVYLAYAECDTDPIPTYVRTCGCCEGSCEHGNCVPSVTREGYVVLVSTIAPPVWRNPVGAAYCTWLETQLKGPGVSPQGYLVANETLDHVLCDVVTEPCPDFCANGNEWLLLATVAFDAGDRLASIDNCTNRRLVLSTGAIVEALGCLTTAVINCCKTKDAYLTLSGAVAPQTVNIETPPADPTLTYTLSVTNADAALNAGAFSIDVLLPSGTTFGSAKLALDGVAQPDPAPNANGVSAGVASLAAGKSAQLVVTATYDPAQEHAGDVLAATASIGGYAGPFAAGVTMTTTFTDVKVDGPRVIIKELPATLSLSDLATLFRNGLPIPFSAAMNPASASAGPASADVFLEAVVGASVTSLPVRLAWSNANALLTIGVAASAAADPAAPVLQQIAAGQSGESRLRIRLLGGPKGSAPATGPTLSGADGMRLDGDPPAGGPPEQRAGQSGNGQQGGDFIWDIAITVPPPVDGPHVKWQAGKLPTKLTFGAAAKQFAPGAAGVNVPFDAAMDQSLPASGAVTTPIVTLNVKGTSVPVVAKWTNATTLNVTGAQPQMEMAIRALASGGGPIVITLAGGPKDPSLPQSPVMQSADGHRLDGSPANGSGALAAAGVSGDGRQGGDFTWTINVGAG